METADQLDRLQSGRDVALWVRGTQRPALLPALRPSSFAESALAHALHAPRAAPPARSRAQVVIGMVIVLVLVFLAFRHLMGIVATARTGLFSVFLLIPIPVTVQLAERTVQTGALSQEDEDAFNLSIAGAEHMLGAPLSLSFPISTAAALVVLRSPRSPQLKCVPRALCLYMRSGLRGPAGPGAAHGREPEDGVAQLPRVGRLVAEPRPRRGQGGVDAHAPHQGVRAGPAGARLENSRGERGRSAPRRLVRAHRFPTSAPPPSGYRGP